MLVAVDIKRTGENINKLLTECGIKKCDASKKIGAHTNAVYKWTHGYSLPNLENLLALSVLFEKKVEDILVWNVVDS